MTKGCKYQWPIALLMAVLLAGCGSETPIEESQPPVAVPQVAEEPPVQLEASDLQPVIREVASAGVAATKIVIELARPVVDPGQVDKPLEGTPLADGTELQFEPPVDGTLSFTSPSTLTFKPRDGFAANTQYRVELVSLATRDGVLQRPEPGRWQRVFRTPGFDFVRFAIGRIDYPKGRAEMELVFSGAVDAKEVARRARLTAYLDEGGAAAKPRIRFVGGDEPHTVRAVLASRDIRPGVHVELNLAAGVPSAADAKTSSQAARAKLQLGVGPVAKVLKAYRAEGTSGFYVQVVCNDSAVKAKRYYWDRVDEEYYPELSSRCLIDEADAAAGLRFEPAVDFSIAPAGGGFRIFGDFQRGSYQMRLDAGVRTADGGMVHQAFESELVIPARSAQVRFVSKGRYLPRSAWNSLPVRHLNVDDVRVLVRHVPADNLVFWMSDQQENADGRTSNLILDASMPVASEVDIETTTYIDLASRIPPDIKGLLQVQILAGKARDTARLLLTDLHLIAKRMSPGEEGSGDRRKVQAWALDLETLKPLRDVDIRLVRRSGFVLDTCATGGDGGCELNPHLGAMDPSPPFALVASRGDELTYLKFDELEAEIQEERIAGEPYAGARAYRAALYSDRGVYRPGETAHVAAIVRQQSNEAPPAGMPVQAQLRDPQGQLIKSTALATNEAGFVSVDVDFPAFAKTGRYQAQLQVAGESIGQYSFQVEEFVPERMKVDVASSTPAYRLGEPMRLDVASRYLFGGVPAQHRVEVQCELHPSSFSPAQNANFHYGVWRPEDQPVRPLQLGTLSGQLDDTGEATLACPGDQQGPRFHGPAQLRARAAVFESGSGRTTVGQTALPVHPEDFYLGLNSSASKVESGNDLVVEGVAVDWHGNQVKTVASVDLELIRLEAEYGWYWDETRGRESYRRHLRPVVEETTQVAAASGSFRHVFKPTQNGSRFLVRATAGQARTDLELEGAGDWYYWSPRESDVDQTPRPGRPTWLAVETPEQIRVGERFPISVKAPYGGRLLLTAETDRVLWSRWLEVDAGEIVEFTKLKEFVPNLYLTAFLIKDPHLDSAQAFLPGRAFGVHSVRVEPSRFTHALDLDVPSEVRSGSQLKVRLDLGKKVQGKTWATVAAVDEGILSLTRFESPNPLPQIFTRRALGVETFETIGWTLLIPPVAGSDTAGGDVQGDLGRVQPIEPVALWSGLVEVPPSGKVEVDFDLPSYRGELRVMAVTAGKERMGHASASVTVRDPLVLQATLPRFLSRDDELRIPVHVTNLSGEDRQIEVSIESEAVDVPGLAKLPAGDAPVALLGDSQSQLRLADGQGDTAVFRARALHSSGAARLRVTVKSGDLVSTEEAVVPLLASGPKSRISRTLPLEAGTTDLSTYLEGWLPMTERSSFWVTNNPYGESFQHLKHLVRYPYGCIEQTTSSTRPLLYLANLIGHIDPELMAENDLEAMVQSGIDRLLSMQTPSGGFSYWPGGGEPVDWGTAYATHLLLDAQKLSYPVPQERLDAALAWMQRRISNHYEKGKDNRGHYAEPYLHFVLATAGKGHSARAEKVLNNLKGNLRGRQLEHKFMLQAALHMMGDQRFEAALRRPDLSAVSDQRTNDWSFYSDRRRRGFMLSTLVDLFGRDAEVERLATLVVESLRGRSAMYSTQELVWSISGLGKLVDGGARDFAPPVLRAGGRTIEPLPAAGESSDRIWNLARASEYDGLTLEVPSKDEGKLYLILSSEGVRETPDWKTGGDGLRVERRYLNSEGQPLDFASHRLGDLVYVELQVRNTLTERISNIALVDRIPAGWEIENPRLGRDGAIPWLQADRQWQADHMDLRDDRLEVFGHLERNETRQLVYAVRAVTSGSFTVPTVEAEAMYDPRIWAREAGQRVEVQGPWSSAQ